MGSLTRDIDPAYAEDEVVSRLRDELVEVSRDVVRPMGEALDSLVGADYESIADADSPYWDVMDEIREVVPRRSFIPEEFGGDGMNGREFHATLETLGWGSPGLAMGFAVDVMPALFATMSFDDDLVEEYVEPWLSGELDHQGCWGVTEPRHGSETLMVESLLKEGAGADDVPPPDVTATRDGDEYVIDGAKASWVTAAPMATHCALHVDVDAARGSHGGLCLVELDRDGVTKGPPIDKIGQRDCPQGELVFDGVRIPERNMIMTPEMLHPDTGYVSFDQILCFTSCGMASVSAGLARAAFEEALEYAREREQAGKPIAEHQAVKLELYRMFEKVETARAYSRRVTEHVWSRTLESFEFDASHAHALAAQVYCKRTAFEVAHKAVQIHGANGITRDYPVEKMFRDARVKLIEDGTLDVLGLEAATDVVDGY
ncbi:MAG: acyl-CoA dehydrogenase family protein [Halobacteriota archaeon]